METKLRCRRGLGHSLPFGSIHGRDPQRPGAHPSKFVGVPARNEVEPGWKPISHPRRRRPLCTSGPGDLGGPILKPRSSRQDDSSITGCPDGSSPARLRLPPDAQLAKLALPPGRSRGTRPRTWALRRPSMMSRYYNGKYFPLLRACPCGACFSRPGRS